MSEMTQCNFCRLKELRARAKAAGLRVTLLTTTSWALGGFNIYKHPKSIQVSKLPEQMRSKYSAGWMKEIGQHCEC